MALPTVIVPSRNAANLVACLTALRKHEPDCPVIVVDDGVDWLRVAQETTVLERRLITSIRGPEEFIFARNCNIGIRAAGDSDVVLLNDDALLESPGGFQVLQHACSVFPEIGVIGATTNVTGQVLQYRNLEGGVRIVPHIAFVCVLIPRRTINLIGDMVNTTTDFTDGLDERYCLDYGCDDADYCEQVTRVGLKVAVHDGCYVDHGSLTSTYRGDPRAAKSFAQNYRLLMEKWGKLESQPK